jgi:hypothetical protein
MQDFDAWRYKNPNLSKPGHLHDDIALFLNTHGYKYSEIDLITWNDGWMHKGTVNEYLERRKRDDLIKIWTEP